MDMDAISTAVTSKLKSLRPRTLSVRLLLISFLALLLIISALIGYLVVPGSALKATPRTDKYPQSRVLLSISAQQVETLGQEYMHDLFHQQYDNMWSMLHPQVQSQWSSEEAFTTYLKRRFQDYTLESFTTGQVFELSYWIDPETMLRYDHVEFMTISLKFDPLISSHQHIQVPLLDQHPSQLFQNLPFIVQYNPDPNYKGQTSQWFILSSGPTDLEAPILPPIVPVNQTVKVPILMYHHISNALTKNLLDLSLTVTPTMFSKQLDYLKIRGYHTITFNQLFASLYYNGPLPTKPIILTFDDGYDDAYTFAYPILKAHGYSGMFYIITGKVGWRGQMTWNQMQEMLANGMQMGSHTIHHVDMGRVWQSSPEQAQQELTISQLDMEKNLGIVVQQFCYPSGEPFRHGTLAQQNGVIALLTKDGYIGATTDPGRTGIVQDSKEPFILLRIRVDGRSSIREFILSMPF